RAQETQPTARATHPLRGRRTRRRGRFGESMTNASTLGSVAAAPSAAKNALSLEVLPNGVAVITYDVPGEAVNTLKATFADEFDRTLRQIARDRAIKAAVLISGKPDTWIAGADIEMLKAIGTAAQAEAMCRTGHQAVVALVDCPKPVVAAVHGAALG